jgi:hypothetical protein
MRLCKLRSKWRPIVSEATLVQDSHSQPARQMAEAFEQSIQPDGKRDPKKKALADESWWWTLSGPEAACESCGAKLPAGQKIAYHYRPAKVYCPDCARQSGVAGLCKASKKLQRSQRALERHSAKALELKEALERHSAKALELREALLEP